MKSTILAFVTLALATALPAQEPVAATSQPSAKASYTVIAAWPMEGCIVSGRPLEEGKAKTFEVDGRTYKTCCGRCQAKVEKDPAKYAAKLDEAIVAAQLASYPLETCPLSDRKLGDKAKNVVLEGTLVRVCCGKCEKKAPEKADALVGKVMAASYAAQAKSYPMNKCPVSGHEIDGKGTEVMYGTTLVRFCCDDCIDEFKASPNATLAELHKARAKGKSHDKAKAKDKKPAGDKKGRDNGVDGGADGAGDCCSAEGGAAASCCEEKAGEKAAAKTGEAAKSCCCEGGAKAKK